MPQIKPLIGMIGHGKTESGQVRGETVDNNFFPGNKIVRGKSPRGLRRGENKK